MLYAYRYNQNTNKAHAHRTLYNVLPCDAHNAKCSIAMPMQSD